MIVGHDSLQIELERRRDGDDREALLQHLEDLEIVAHHEVGLAGQQELHAVDLRAAHLERDIEPSLLVKPGRLGLIEAAVLGLCEPAREKRHLVGRRRRGRPHDYAGHHRRQRADAPKAQNIRRHCEPLADRVRGIQCKPGARPRRRIAWAAIAAGPNHGAKA